MTGFYLLFVAALWLAFVVWFSKTVTKKLPMDTWRVPVALAVFAAVLPLPLLDEIVAGRQFEQLCKDNAEIQVNRVTAAGKTVYFDSQPRIEVEGTWVRVVLQPYRYIDATTRETVVSYNESCLSG